MDREASIKAKGRIVALDFTKGTLVLFMILYHWLNYFVTPTGSFYNYLRFITPSFIFISGFLVTNVALAKYSHDERRLRWRLMERGLKLLALFTLLNLAAGLLLPGTGSNVIGKVQDPGIFFGNAKAVYLTGNGKGAAFQILVPISYTLILGGLLTLAGRRFKALAFVCAGIGAISISILCLTGYSIGQIDCLVIGVLGLCVGTIPLQNIDRLLSFPMLLGVVYGIYLIIVTILDVSYIIQMAGSLLTLLVFYGFGKLMEGDTKIYQTVITLGKYSLFAYISQIALLHVIRLGLGHIDLGSVSLPVSFVASFALSITVVLVIDFMRSKSRITDQIYRYVFA